MSKIHKDVLKLKEFNFVCVDFEATERGECLSIGAVYDKKRFYSLMRPKKLKDVTPRIIEMTNIRPSDVENARIPDVVFGKFYDWVPKNCRFFCYGNYDRCIVKRTQLDPKLKGFMCSRITDISKPLSTLLGSSRGMQYSLKACYEKLFGDVKQNHNALSDAKILKKICDYFCGLSDYELFMFARENLNFKGISSDMSDEDFTNLNRILSAMSVIRGKTVTLKYIKKILEENSEKVLTN